MADVPRVIGDVGVRGKAVGGVRPCGTPRPLLSPTKSSTPRRRSGLASTSASDDDGSSDSEAGAACNDAALSAPTGRARSSGVGRHKHGDRRKQLMRSTAAKGFVNTSVPPQMSLRNTILAQEVYAKSTLTADSPGPTADESAAFEAAVEDALGTTRSAADVRHFCTCFKKDCATDCTTRRQHILDTALGWYKWFELAEEGRRCVAPDLFHVKSLVDHALVTLLLDRGERRPDKTEKVEVADTEQKVADVDWGDF
mmetsp:Transcript_11167/g.35472  ORF Transcript_11167/g.35472 Transcript_11167/m.35472 type:complete len:255 (-) Transcript_11167:67-831(-)